MASVLVTGGAGFIGSFVVDKLLDRGESVVVLDNLDPQVHPDCWSKSGEVRVPDYCSKDPLYLIGDVTNPDDVAAALDGCDRVVHLAAKVGVGQSAYELSDYYQTNAIGTAVLMEAIAKKNAESGPDETKVRRVFTAGSMSCYGEGAYRILGGGLDHIRKGKIRSESALEARRWDQVFGSGEEGQATFREHGIRYEPTGTSEEIPFVCSSIYAETKRSQEEITRIACEALGVSWVVGRFFNCYGPRQALGNPYTGVAAIFSSQIRNGKPPTIFEDGRQSRDFIYVEDLANAVVSLLDTEDAIGAYNIGTGIPTTISDLAEWLLQLYGRDELGTEIVGRYRVGDIRHCISDSSKLYADTDITESDFRPLSEGIRLLVEWVEKQSPKEDGTDAAYRELEERGLVR